MALKALQRLYQGNYSGCFTSVRFAAGLTQRHVFSTQDTLSHNAAGARMRKSWAAKGTVLHLALTLFIPATACVNQHLQARHMSQGTHSHGTASHVTHFTQRTSGGIDVPA